MAPWPRCEAILALPARPICCRAYLVPAPNRGNQGNCSRAASVTKNGI